MDQRDAILRVIDYLGNIAPGTRCSAVFFDKDRIVREKEFYRQLYSENGVHDREVLRDMVDANVPNDPYWLVSLKTGTADVEKTTLFRVDDRTRAVISDLS